MALTDMWVWWFSFVIAKKTNFHPIKNNIRLLRWYLKINLRLVLWSRCKLYYQYACSWINVFYCNRKHKRPHAINTFGIEAMNGWIHFKWNQRHHTQAHTHCQAMLKSNIAKCAFLCDRFTSVSDSMLAIHLFMLWVVGKQKVHKTSNDKWKPTMRLTMKRLLMVMVHNIYCITH